MIMKNMVGWIDSVPTGWNVMSFSQVIKRISTGLNPRDNFKLTKNDERYYVTIKNFKDGKLYLDDKCDRISKNAWKVIQERSNLHKGDILLASISKEGQVYLLKEEPNNWNINESVFCIRVNKRYMNNKYFCYEITNVRYYDDLLMDATGTTFKSIKQNNLKQSRLLVPPLSEQQAIADYLDQACSKIDEIIAEAKASIDEYKELKQSVIFEAVTKGLDKNVEMKDSGVEWIGRIPASWEYKKIRYIVNDIGDIDHYMPESVGYGIAYLMTGDLSDKVSDIDFERCKQVSYEDYKKLSKKIKAEIGDIIFARYASVGVVCYVDENKEFLVSYSCVVIKPKHDYVNSLYMKYYLQSKAFKEEVLRFANSNVQTNVGKESLLQTKITVPSLHEQKKIVNFLDKKTAEIDSLISEKESLINDLEAYKKSLIYEVVTGKRRVV